MGNLPRLYAKYIGHDDNRDFYMSNMKETTNMNTSAVPGVVSADHVQPPPDRSGRRGDLHAAVPRSVQLQLRSAGSAGHRNGGHRDAQPPGGGGQRRQRHAQRRQLFHLVERRPAHRHLLPQHDRHPHRDHRRTHAHDHSRWSPASSCRRATGPCRSRPVRGTTASRSTTKSPTTAPFSTWPRAIARRSSSTSSAWA